MNEETIANKCINLWGKPDQIRQTIEECSELITKLAKYGRNVNGSTIEQICEEIADVEIMCYQMRIVFNDYLVSRYKEEKLQRLEERVDRES